MMRRSCIVLAGVVAALAFLAPFEPTVRSSKAGTSLAQAQPQEPPAEVRDPVACQAQPDKDCVLAWALEEARSEPQDDLNHIARIAAVWQKPELLKEALALANSRPLGTGRAFNFVAQGQGALGLADQAFRTAGQVPWLTERSQALAAVTQALASRGDLEAALSVARRTPISEYAALGVSYVIEAQAGRGTIELGLKDVQQIKAEGRDHLESRSRAFSGIALAYARNGKLEEAAALARKIANPEFAAPALAGVAAIARQPELFDEALAMAGKGSESQRDKALAAVAPRLAEARRIDEALAIARKLGRAALRDAALAGIIPAMAAQGRDGEAMALLREIGRPASRGSAVFGIAAAWVMGAAGGGPLPAHTVADYEGLLAAAKRLDVKTDHQVRRGFAGLLAASGQVAAASDLANGVFDPRRRADVLASLALLTEDRTLLIKAAGLAGDYAPALRSLSKAYGCLGAPQQAAELIAGQDSREFRIAMLVDLAKCLPPRGPDGSADLKRRKMRPDLPDHGFSRWSPQGASLAGK